MRRCVLPLVVLLVAALPAEATADIRFSGKTAQERIAKLRTDDAGFVKRFYIRWRAPCANRRFVFVSSTRSGPPFDSLTRDRVADADAYRARYDNGERAIFNTHWNGDRVSEHRWRGVFRIGVRVFRGGRQIDRCSLRTRWRAVRHI